MDNDRVHRKALLLTAVLAAAAAGAGAGRESCRAQDLFAPLRSGFRAVTQLIRVQGPAPLRAPTLTTGVRG